MRFVLILSVLSVRRVQSVGGFVVPFGKFSSSFSAASPPRSCSWQISGRSPLVGKLFLRKHRGEHPKLRMMSEEVQCIRPPRIGNFFIKLPTAVTIGLRLSVVGDDPSCVLALEVDGDSRNSIFSCSWSQAIPSLRGGRVLYIKGAPAGFLVWFDPVEHCLKLIVSSSEARHPTNGSNKMVLVTDQDLAKLYPLMACIESRLSLIASTLQMYADDFFTEPDSEYVHLRPQFLGDGDYRQGITSGSRYTTRLYSLTEPLKVIKICMLVGKVLKGEVVVDLFVFSTSAGFERVPAVHLKWVAGEEPLLVCTDVRLLNVVNRSLDPNSALNEVVFMWRKLTSELFMIQGHRGPVPMKIVKTNDP